MSSSVAASQSQSNVNFQPAINYEFAAVPTAILDEIDHPTALRLIVVLYDCIRRGWVDPPIRYLAARVDRCRKQVERALAILETAGRLLITRRKISPARNGTNVYAIPGFSPSQKLSEKRDDTNVAEVLTPDDANTKAPRPAAPDLSPFFGKIKIKFSAALEQIGFHKDRADRAEKRLAEERQFHREWNQQGEQIHQSRECRSRRREAEERMAADIRTLRFREPVTPAEVEAEDRRLAAAEVACLIGLATAPAQVREDMLRHGQCTQAQIDEGFRLLHRGTRPEDGRTA